MSEIIAAKTREILVALGASGMATAGDGDVVKALDALLDVCLAHFGDGEELSEALAPQADAGCRKAVSGCDRVYADGSCLGNPGPGGWAFAFVMDGDVRLAVSGGDGSTTNNRMELLAVIRALETCLSEGVRSIAVCSDSKYCVDGATSWIRGWKRNGWKGTKGPVKNDDLWKRLDAAMSGMDRVDFVHVKGHAGDRLNELVDGLANDGAGRASSGNTEEREHVRKDS